MFIYSHHLNDDDIGKILKTNEVIGQATETVLTKAKYYLQTVKTFGDFFIPKRNKMNRIVLSKLSSI